MAFIIYNVLYHWIFHFDKCKWECKNDEWHNVTKCKPNYAGNGSWYWVLDAQSEGSNVMLYR